MLNGTNQRCFITELLRVARRVFITVPHRFFPVEHHTGIPLAHWSDTSFRLACRLTGKTRWSRPDELILMSRRRLSQLVPSDRRIEIGHTVGRRQLSSSSANRAGPRQQAPPRRAGALTRRSTASAPPHREMA